MGRAYAKRGDTQVPRGGIWLCAGLCGYMGVYMWELGCLRCYGGSRGHQLALRALIDLCSGPGMAWLGLGLGRGPGMARGWEYQDG